jgi:hypothetical protein
LVRFLSKQNGQRSWKKPKALGSYDVDDDELSNHKQRQKVKGRKKRKIKRGKRKVVELKTPVAAAVILQRLYRRRFGFLKMVKMAQDRFKPFTYKLFLIFELYAPQMRANMFACTLAIYRL